MTTEDRDPTSVAVADSGRAPGVAVARVRPAQAQAPAGLAETILLLGIALVLAIVIKALFVQAFYIPSESMEPGLVKNDRILVEKPSYWFDGPERGDIVVFKDPGAGWPARRRPARPGPSPRRCPRSGSTRRVATS